MKIKLLAIGKTDDKNLQMLISTYEARLKHYIKFELELIPDLKNVKNLLHGEKNGKEIGKMSCIVVNAVKEIKLRHCNCYFSY